MINREILRKKTVQVLYAGFIKQEINPVEIEKELKTSIERTYYLYNHLLQLMVEIWHYGEMRNEALNSRFLRSSLSEPIADQRFIENKFIKRLSESEALQKNIEDGKISWSNHSKAIKALYDKVLTSDFYHEYIAEESVDFDKDKKFWINIFKKVICENYDSSDLRECSIDIDAESKEAFVVEEAMANALRDSIDNKEVDLKEVLEEDSIYWNDDFEFVSKFVVKTMKHLTEEPGDDDMLPMFKKDDSEGMKFAFNIADYVVINNDKLNSTIEKYLVSWDIKRVQTMDLTILKAAITELLYIPMIPAYVTLNEYIELSKHYSSPKSIKFINGILNRFVEDNKEKFALKLPVK